MAQRTATNKPALPVVLISSDAFRNGYETSQRNNEYIGWPTKHAPKEETVVQFLHDAITIITADMASGHNCEYETRWVAGLLVGWLRREQ